MDVLTSRLAQACTAARQHHASREQLQKAGLTTAQISALVRDGGLRRLRRGSYALAPLPSRARHLLSDGRVDLGYLAEVRSVTLSIPGATADRRTSAICWQMDMLVEPKKVEVRVPRSNSRADSDTVRARSSDAVRATRLAVRGLEEISVLPALDTVIECCLDRPMQEAVVIADSALRRKLVTVAELEAAVSARGRKPGSRKLRRLLALVDPDSGSVLESLCRYLLNTNDLWPESQVVVKTRDGKRTIGRVDFVIGNVVIECDGRRWHDPQDARDKDRERNNGLARTGRLVLRFTWDEVRHSPAYVLASVREALMPAAA